MGYSSYLIYSKLNVNPNAGKALQVYALKSVFNWTWSPIFFGYKKLGLSLINIYALAGSVAWTIYEFYKVDPLAAQLNIPYFLWVSFASVLNTFIWWNNSSPTKKQ